MASGFWALFVLSEGETSRVRVVALRRRAAAAKAVASGHLGRSPVLKASHAPPETREVSCFWYCLFMVPSFLNNSDIFVNSFLRHPELVEFLQLVIKRVEPVYMNANKWCFELFCRNQKNVVTIIVRLNRREVFQTNTNVL